MLIVSLPIFGFSPFVWCFFPPRTPPLALVRHLFRFTKRHFLYFIMEIVKLHNSKLLLMSLEMFPRREKSKTGG